MSTFNGWTNYETWNVALWLDNDASSQGLMNEMAAQTNVPHHLGDLIRQTVEEWNPLTGQASMFSDLLTAALQEVNWEEIASHYIADNPPDEDEEEGEENV